MSLRHSTFCMVDPISRTPAAIASSKSVRKLLLTNEDEDSRTEMYTSASVQTTKAYPQSDGHQSTLSGGWSTTAVGPGTAFRLGGSSSSSSSTERRCDFDVVDASAMTHALFRQEYDLWHSDRHDSCSRIITFSCTTYESPTTIVLAGTS